MAVQIPLVRHFIACEQVEQLPGLRYSLHRLIHRIRLLPGSTFPWIEPEVWLFVLMSNGQGLLDFRIELVYQEAAETSIYTSRPVKLDLGQDPLVVHGWPICLQNLPFPEPGLYEFRLFCQGQEIAREPIVLEESR